MRKIDLRLELLKFLVVAVNNHLEDLRFTMYKVQFESSATCVAGISKIMQPLLLRALRARAVGAAMHCYSCGDPGWAYRREAPSRQIIQIVHCKS